MNAHPHRPPPTMECVWTHRQPVGDPSVRRLEYVLQQLSHPQQQEQQQHALQELYSILSSDRHADGGSSMSHAALDRQADRTLCWLLSYTMQSASTTSSALPAQPSSCAVLICDCLNALWTRASTNRRKASIQQVPDALPWLAHVWQLYGGGGGAMCGNHAHTNNTNILESVVGSLRSWAKISDATIKGLMIQSGVIARLRVSLGGDTAGTHRLDVSPVRNNMLGLIKDLVFRATAADKELLYRELQVGLLQQQQQPCNNSLNAAADEAVSAVLWNWAALESLGRTMAENSRVWTTLEAFIMVETHHQSIPVHRNASSALGSIIAAWTTAQSTSLPPPIMIMEQAWVVVRLLEILETETDVDWRRRCMRTIRCLASCEWGRAFLWQHAKTPEYFLNVLVQVLQNANGGSDARIQACQTIASLSPSAKERWASLGPYVETVLVQTMEDAESPDKLVLAASHTLQIWLDHSPWKRGNSCSKALYERVHAALVSNIDNATYHSGFSQFLLQLVYESSNNESSMVCPAVLSMLTTLLSVVGPDYEVSRGDAMKVIALFMKDDTHKKRLAENEGLLTALVNFCLISNGDLKDQAKQFILRLVPEL